MSYYESVTYVYPSGEHDQREVWMIPPAIGHGYVDPKGDRYRIVDVWAVDDKHGAFEYGVYAFLELATSEDDRLGNLHPEYYRPEEV